MSRKKLNIGLFGFGCVGYGLYQVLQKTSGLNAEITRICVKDKTKQRQIPSHHFTYDLHELLDDESINTIVELIDDSEAAFEIVKYAMIKGKSVVTANKKMIAEHFTELLELQKEYGVPLLYEAAVCASIPIIRNLEEYYDNDLLESLQGIVNGSTNYILTKTSEEKISYEEALSDAQAKGYAESDPVLDTGGYDAKYKLQILLTHAFGIIVKPEEIYNIGIDRIGNLELNYAREKGFKIKLVAHAFKTGENKVGAFVAPRFIGPGEKLFQVDDVYNGVQLETAFAEKQFFSGKGAGAYPTASAVLSDISALSYDYKYEYKKIRHQSEIKYTGNFKVKVFLRASQADLATIQKYLTEVNETYQTVEEGFVIGVIDYSLLKEVMSLFDVSAVCFGLAKDEAILLDSSEKALVLVES